MESRLDHMLDADPELEEEKFEAWEIYWACRHIPVRIQACQALGVEGFLALYEDAVDVPLGAEEALAA